MNARSPDAFETGNTIISRTIKKLGLSAAFKKHRLFASWTDVVGAEMARFILPQKLEFGVLYVYAASSAWANNFQYLKMDVLKKINEYAGTTLVKDIQFTRFRKKNEMKYSPVWEQKVDLGKCLEKVKLTKGDLEDINHSVSKVEDDQLRCKLKRVYMKGVQMAKLKQQYGWQPCRRCGHLTPEGMKYCSACRRTLHQEMLDKITEIFQAVPWARYQDIVKYVECDPETVNKQRDKMVQIEAKQLRAGADYPVPGSAGSYSKKARDLVMLYKSIPPDQLTDTTVEKVIRELKHDIGYGSYKKNTSFAR